VSVPHLISHETCSLNATRTLPSIPLRRPPPATWLLSLLAVALATPHVGSQSAPMRIIAIGDIHGSYDGLVTILRKTGLVGEDLRWTGGRTVLVQTGDYTDRGSDVRKVMDLLMRLEKDARNAGGQAIVLAGNHELMNVIGDLRDVTAEICATFASPGSIGKREEAWKQYERLARGRNPAAPAAAVYQQGHEPWLAAHPPGCIEYREAMGPGGVYGKWLRGKDVATVIGDTLFMHAGLNPSRAVPRSIGEINDRVRAEVRRLDAYRKRLADRRLALPFFSFQEILDVTVAELNAANATLAAAKAEGTEPNLDVPLLREAQEITNIASWNVIDAEGPLWFRGYALWPEDTTAAQVTGFLDQMKLARIVVGHTPTTDRRIATRYGGRVVIIDTGMLAPYYKGQPSALEIVGPRLKAIYPDGEVELSTLPKAAVMLASSGRS
jgi:hypothetical protein